jgi:hypothetical protein
MSGNVPKRFARECAGNVPTVQQPPVDRASSDGIVLDWLGPLDDAEMVDLTRSHGGRPAPGWWERIQLHSFGWVTARDASGMLVGFVIGKRVVAFAAEQAQAAGHEWLHVDFDDDLAPFYFDACGFEPTPAGLIRLT